MSRNSRNSRGRYDSRQFMEAVFTVGQYNLVAMYRNSLGVQFEEGFEGFPVRCVGGPATW